MVAGKNGTLLRQWRHTLGLSMQEAAKRLNMSVRSIENIEQGHRREDDKMTRIALKAMVMAAEIERAKAEKNEIKSTDALISHLTYPVK